MAGHPSLFDPRVAARAARELAARDPALRPVIRRCSPLRLPPRPRGGAFAFLARTVIYQQLAIPAARRIHERFTEAVAPQDGRVTPERLHATSSERLSRAGVSRPKQQALRGLAEAVREGRLSPRGLARRDDDAVAGAITALPGFGRWSAEIFLIFHLGRTDVFPATDLGIRYAVAALDGEPADEPVDPRQAAQRAEPWRPWRSAAAWWLWYHRSGNRPGIA
jgi:3-methyladenine DNA glycosylase/8-oxoguanine DNA glycosylase